MRADDSRPIATKLTRRRLITAAAIGASMSIGNRFAQAQASAPRFDFTKPLEGWTTVSGKWAIEDVAGASQGGRALVQRATDNEFNVIVAPGGPYGNVDVSVRFKPVSGREDASAGIVFRFAEDRYYVIRANALENNFNFYYYDRGRREIAGASVKAPALGQWHKLRIAAAGDRIQGWLNDQALIDRRDSRFASGRIGLWTKADSVTAFDDLRVTVPSG
jgi:3-keto-disaccharide hydrolase